MIQFPTSDEILDGMEAAFNLICSPSIFGDFESWLGRAAYLDGKDDEDRVFDLGSVLTRTASELLACGILTASEADELLISKAATVLEAVKTVRLVAFGLSQDYRMQEHISD